MDRLNSWHALIYIQNMEINNNLSVTCSFTAELVIVLSQH